MIIAISPDNSDQDDPGLRNTSWVRWKEIAEKAGHQVRMVDALKPDILDQLRGCGAFMWRHIHIAPERDVARRLIPVVENQLGLLVYPDQNTSWHFDDKIAQGLLLPAAGIPAPRTWTFWRMRDALEFADQAVYPIVLKLSGGAGASNVSLMHSAAELKPVIRALFGPGLTSLRDPAPANWALMKHRTKLALQYLRHGCMPNPLGRSDLNRDYVLLQEFLPDNAFDTRITVIGNRAFGFRRFNRDNDFRASGSGRINYDKEGIDLATVRLAFRVARTLKTQSVAIDGLRRGEERVVGEISYNYVSGAVHDCPGHWELADAADPESELNWVDGQMWPEEAQMQDFLARIRERELG